MTGPTVLPGRSTCEEQYETHWSNDTREEFVEAPERRNRAGRGALTGVLVGAGLWVAILVATGVIKL